MFIRIKLLKNERFLSVNINNIFFCFFLALISFVSFEWAFSQIFKTFKLIPIF